MTNTNNAIKNIYCYNIIIFLIITIFSSFKCYSINNSEILAFYQEIAIYTTPEPYKPPPSYEDVTSGRNSNVLPAYQQTLIIGNETRVTQKDTTLTETEKYNFSQASIINIPIEHHDGEIECNSCFCKFLKKNKKAILIGVLPYVIPMVIMGILAILVTKGIIEPTKLMPSAFILIFVTIFYGAGIEPYLKRKFITNPS